MLFVDRISLFYDKNVLKDISFSVGEGEVIGIAGKSGAGKSSLLKIISGLLDASSGNVYLGQQKIVGPSQRLIPGFDEVQLVNQDFALDIYQTVEENVRGKILHLHKEVQDQFVDELLELIELNDVRNQKAISLSGGEQQRLAIARALALEPSVLLLDEPFVHLDSNLKMKITNYLLLLKKIRKMSMVIVSHNNEELLSMADQILYLNGGELVKRGSPLDFYYGYSNFEEAKMFGIINQLDINDVKILFRPDEYKIDETNFPTIHVKFLNSIFMGGYYMNKFAVDNKKTIVLSHKEILKDVRGIKIVKRKK